MFPDLLFDNWLLTLTERPIFTAREIQDTNRQQGSSRWRKISIPNREMRQVHQRFFGYLRTLPIVLPNATACLPGCSPRLSLERHRGNRFFYLTDLRAAYQQVDGTKLAKLLVTLDSENSLERISSFLEQYCLLPGGKGLITGAPTSPELFNLYAGILLDRPLAAVSQHYGLTYTRYLDDLVFSSPQKIGEKKRQVIRRYIAQVGLPLAHHKTQVLDLKVQPIKINGYVLHRDGRVSIPKRFRRRLSGMLHLAWSETVSLNRIAGLMGVLRSSRLRGRAVHREPLPSCSDQRLEEEYRKLVKVTKATQARP